MTRPIAAGLTRRLGIVERRRELLNQRLQELDEERQRLQRVLWLADQAGQRNERRMADRVFRLLAGNQDLAFTVEEVAVCCGITVQYNTLHKALLRELRRGWIVRASRGSYRYAKPSERTGDAKP